MCKEKSVCKSCANTKVARLSVQSCAKLLPGTGLESVAVHATIALERAGVSDEAHARQRTKWTGAAQRGQAVTKI